MSIVKTVAELEAIYGETSEASVIKVSDRLTESYRRLIEASPIVAIATCGPEGLDCSPRGDPGTVMTILDDRTLVLPDRRRRFRALASGLLRFATLAMPLGFLFGGLWPLAGDPSPGILFLPLGAVLLVIAIALAIP